MLKLYILLMFITTVQILRIKKPHPEYIYNNLNEEFYNMSSNTKIVVLKSKELIYTGIFIVLGIILILLLFFMFGPSDNDKKKEAQTSTEQNTVPDETEAAPATETMTTYTPGVYTSEINLGGSALLLSVTVDENTISHVDIQNLDETVTAMYPLIGPSLDEINSQIAVVSSLDDITYSKDNQYTTIIIMDAVKKALEPAIQN